MVIGLLPQLSRGFDDPGQQFMMALLLSFGLLPLSVGVYLIIFRWAVSNFRLSCGTPLAFKGTYLSYLGWTFLLAISFYTIIGWAWAGVAMFRWMCNNIEGGGHRVRFVGSGLQLLWRGILVFITSLCLIPIPWMVVWLMKWFAQNLVIEKAEAKIESPMA